MISTEERTPILEPILEPKSLKSVIDNLKDRFFTLAEFPLLDRERRPRNILGTAMKLQQREIRGYALSLKGKEIEGLILELRNPLSDEEMKRASEILTIRAKPRIMKLLTALYQYYDAEAAVNEVLKAMAIHTVDQEDSSREAAFIKSFGAEEDKISAFCRLIEENAQDIDRSFSEFSIIRQSPFAKKAAFAYLEHASKEGLLNNLRWIVKTIAYYDKEELYDIINNYLNKLDLSEFSDAVNLSILQKIGQPYISPDWSRYDTGLCNKFAQWFYLHQLKIHSIGYPRKYSILRKYSDQVRNSYEIKEEKLMVIDFGDIAVADIEEDPYSFFYEKSVFDKEMTDWKNSLEAEAGWSQESGEEKPAIYLPSFLRLDKKSATARDFIIEETEDSCVKLSYEGVDILYIQEMLDIKMGLEPDFRRKQLAKLRKEHSRKEVRG